MMLFKTNWGDQVLNYISRVREGELIWTEMIMSAPPQDEHGHYQDIRSYEGFSL
jgi:hypothetical protein